MKIIFRHEIKPGNNINADEIVKILLRHRQIKNIKEFLSPASPLTITLTDFNSKYKNQLKKTVKILEEIKKRDGMVVVYTDYDTDGITGGAILWEMLHLLGIKTMPYVPDRKLEGYGFSKKGIDNVKRLFNPNLIISVDHGITKVDEVKYAKSLNIPIIITDHHLKADKTPRAEAIFHISELSGAGVAYFFAKDLFNHLKTTTENYQRLKKYFSVDYIVLAAIGIVADMVPLTNRSRNVVKWGLEKFKQIDRPGLKHILKEAGIENKEITTYEIGFIIAPRINSIGRLENAIEVLRLLCTNREDKAYRLAQKVGQKNTERQLMVEKSVAEALKQVEEKYPDLNHIPKIIILVSDRWVEGIVGLVASKIAEKYYRPTIVITKSAESYKGSARSIPSFHITDFLRSLKKYLIDVGGHKQAAGFDLEKNNITKFVKAAEKKAENMISEKDLEKQIVADLKIPLSKINLSLVKSLEKLQPFGIGNPQPTFFSRVVINGAQFFGKQNNHLKIFVKDIALGSRINNLGSPLELIAFNAADQFTKLSRGQTIDVVYRLEIDRWGGKEKLRGKLINFF